ncbi:uncharacterized protein PAC_09421 [Phialocephala subalpina]|uniref:BZIP domain-containing protein n=1 Tax=Phialocephala subalpina TaxID=576137 RepID=A0A1L7X3G3_9HELO|nr:uncharacterized protein PAC_09421 [Phialocephala subalpina]
MGTAPPDDPVMAGDEFLHSLNPPKYIFDPQFEYGLHDSDLERDLATPPPYSLIKTEEAFPESSKGPLVSTVPKDSPPVYSWGSSVPADDVKISTNLLADFNSLQSSLGGFCKINFNESIFPSPACSSQSYTKGKNLEPTPYHYPYFITGDLSAGTSNFTFALPEAIPDVGQLSLRKLSEDSNSTRTSFSSSSEEAIIVDISSPAQVVDTCQPVVAFNKHGKPKRKRGRKRSKLSDDERRKKRLERGRYAANKCRSKKKEWEDALVAEVDALTQEHARIEQEKCTLKEDIKNIKATFQKCPTCWVQYLNYALLKGLTAEADYESVQLEGTSSHVARPLSAEVLYSSRTAFAQFMDLELISRLTSHTNPQRLQQKTINNELTTSINAIPDSSLDTLPVITTHSRSDTLPPSGTPHQTNTLPLSANIPKTDIYHGIPLPSISSPNAQAYTPTMSANNSNITKAPAMTPEELELALLETVLEAAWNNRVARIPLARSQAERNNIRHDEMDTCFIAVEGIRYKASVDYLRARMILLRFEAELAEFEERRGWL